MRFTGGEATVHAAPGGPPVVVRLSEGTTAYSESVTPPFESMFQIVPSAGVLIEF